MDSVTAHADPASERRITTFTPLGRRATVDEIAARFAFLASAAASYVAGSVLAVDGGYTAICRQPTTTQILDDNRTEALEKGPFSAEADRSS